MIVLRRIGRLWLVPVVIVVWELATRALGDDSFPPPSTIAGRMREMWLTGPPSRLWINDSAIANIPPSVVRLLGGWLAAALAGVTLGLLLGRSALLSRLFEPIVHFLRAIPPPMLLSFFLALFAIGPEMQVATIIFGVIWPILINSADGARTIDRQHLDTALVFGLSRGQRLWRVILPSATPKIFAGLRVSLSLALILMVISELVGSTEGIGYQLLDARRSYDRPGVWATIVILGVLGFLLNSAFLAVERRVLSWHRTAKQTT
ncbi:ABC transporter permease [Streptosporangium sp. KLBMP 9127]|nr:ABC transporter permease [Streptosporangium sp. KLBMP 9127]